MAAESLPDLSVSTMQGVAPGVGGSMRCDGPICTVKKTVRALPVL